MPLIGAPQGQHNWWTEGKAGHRRALEAPRNELRNGAGDWAQEGGKAKPISPQPATARKTNRNGLASSKPAEGIFF